MAPKRDYREATAATGDTTRHRRRGGTNGRGGEGGRAAGQGLREEETGAGPSVAAGPRLQTAAAAAPPEPPPPAGGNNNNDNKHKRQKIRLAAFNIRSGRAENLIGALRAMEQMGVDLGILMEIKLTDDIYT